MLSAGLKNLEYVAKGSMQKGHILFGESVCGIYGRSFLVMANFFLEAAANGGKGSMYCHVLTGEGLYDPADPWGQPKGDMVMKVSFYIALIEPRSCAGTCIPAAAKVCFPCLNTTQQRHGVCRCNDTNLCCFASAVYVIYAMVTPCVIHTSVQASQRLPRLQQHNNLGFKGAMQPC